MKLYCRKCKKKDNILDWNQVGGMMLIEVIKGKKYYNAVCPECGQQYIPIAKAKKWATDQDKIVVPKMEV
jgi:hypothetical protein